MPRSYYRRLILASLASFAAVIVAISPTFAAAEAIASPPVSAFVLFTRESRSAEMNGSMDDVRRAMSLRSGNEGLLYVRQGGAAYIVRDAAVLRKAKSFFEPEEALGARQTELGSLQSALGQQQSRLGAQQADLSRRQARSGPSEADDLSRQEEILSHQEEALGRQQEAFGRQQEELGREQSRVARIAGEQVQKLFADALRLGIAQRVE